MVFEAKPTKGKNLRFDKWFQMLITLVEARSMNQSQPKKQAPVLKDVSKCRRVLLTIDEIVAKKTLSSEAKEKLC